MAQDGLPTNAAASDGRDCQDTFWAAENELISSPVIICSPHPDDECLTGALPLRLLREKKAKVFNLAVTLGSDINRKDQRKKELEDACSLLGFQNRIVGGGLGLDNVRGDFREAFPDLWRKNVESVVEHFFQVSPGLVFSPHEGDGHPTHEGTNLLVSDALSLYTGKRQTDVLAVESEFWSTMKSPNILVGLGNNDLALLLAALSQHKGEMSRNPYHLWMPARLMDNVRRGWEIIRGCREKAPDFCFAELYRVSVYSKGEKKRWGEENKVFPPGKK